MSNRYFCFIAVIVLGAITLHACGGGGGSSSGNSSSSSTTTNAGTYTITATAESNGSISPSGSTTITSGGSQTFAIIPNTNYRVQDVLVDGTSIGAVTSYTFTNVTANHTISATFTVDAYTIIATTGTGGSISPSGAISVALGGSQTFTITPDSGYSVSNVLVDGASVGSVTTYTFSNVRTDHTISASFTVDAYTIIATTGTGGSISPSGAISVALGGSQTFTITPDSGYSVSNVLVDGASVGSVTTYTFSNVRTDHTISASFTLNTDVNKILVTVNGSLCSSDSYLNKPCVSVTVCSTDGSSCQTIDDILLDTGSYGLRVFGSLLSTSLTQITSGSGSLAECVQYGDGSSNWGPVKMATVKLGGEPAVQVPIQVIDSTYATRPSSCANPDVSPSKAGFNGILGVGYFVQDCGSYCSTSASNGMYYSCSGTTCMAVAAPLTSQVQNPVALLPFDNNGVIVQLPSVGTSGAQSANGYLFLGIGTRSNNAPSASTVFPVDGSGDFDTTLSGTMYTSFVDTGSNGLFIGTPPSVIARCSGTYSDWFCPASTTTYSATNSGYNGTPTASVSFQIANMIAQMATGNSVFSNIGGYMPSYFDWGLPFYLGKTIYMGIETRSSTLSAGTYWAY